MVRFFRQLRVLLRHPFTTIQLYFASVVYLKNNVVEWKPKWARYQYAWVMATEPESLAKVAELHRYYAYGDKVYRTTPKPYEYNPDVFDTEKFLSEAPKETVCADCGRSNEPKNHIRPTDVNGANLNLCQWCRGRATKRNKSNDQ